LVVMAVAWLVGANPDQAVSFVWITLGIAGAWALLEFSEPATIRAWTPAVVTIGSFLATYLCLPPNCGVPKYNLSQELTQAAPLDPQRLYLSVHPPPERTYRLENRAEPFGTTVRIGSTSMWGGVQLINGYSPIRPVGVAREFAFAIHGEIPDWMGEFLLGYEARPNGRLAQLGVDGIIVAKEMALQPQPAGEWEPVVATEEGQVFHRAGGPLRRVRSVVSIDSRPNEQFAVAEISRIVNGRNRLQADVMVPSGDRPALLTISRPFFRGYQAKLGERSLKVDSYRALFPIIEIPAGTSGPLTLVYRPRWLIWGGIVAGISLLVVLAGTIGAVASARHRNEAGS